MAQSAARLKEAAKLGFNRAIVPEAARSEMAEPSLKVTDVTVLRASSRTLPHAVKHPARQNCWTRRVTAPSAPRYIRRIKTGSGGPPRHPAASAEMG